MEDLIKNFNKEAGENANSLTSTDEDASSAQLKCIPGSKEGKQNRNEKLFVPRFFWPTKKRSEPNGPKL